VDEEGVRWVFPALRPEEPASAEWTATDGVAAVPSLEEIRASAERLRARRLVASAREGRPFRGAASDEGHEIDPEEALLRSYGGEGESESRASESASTDPERRLALAVGSAIHGALEIFDPAGDRESEIDRCRCRIEAVLSLLLGPADRAEARSRADELFTRFAAGPLLERLREIAPHVIARELPVLLPPGQGERSAVGFVSGAIDLLYRDPQGGSIVVADYKTDRVESPDQIRERVRIYQGQGGIYLRGIREALDLKGDFRFELWFLHAGLIEVVPM
jgi:ATP-dependent exoDNAse (exonuclease V) beta subunit